MADSPCGLFQNEVFVDTNGDYVGDFTIGDGPVGPFGFVRCMSLWDDPTFSNGVFDAFKEPACQQNGFARTPYIDVQASFGVQSLSTVADSSGPPGLEDVAAMQVDLSGAPGQYLGWAGVQVVDPVTLDWILDGILDADTGWNPGVSDTWVFQCWAKVVLDDNGEDVSGATLAFARGVKGYGSGAVPAAGSLTLSTDWQFYQAVFPGIATPTGPWSWPLIVFGGSVISNSVTYTKVIDTGLGYSITATLNGYAKKGRVLIKCPHLYQTAGFVSEGNWIDQFHGHG